MASSFSASALWSSSLYLCASVCLSLDPSPGEKTFAGRLPWRAMRMTVLSGLAGPFGRRNGILEERQPLRVDAREGRRHAGGSAYLDFAALAGS